VRRIVPWVDDHLPTIRSRLGRVIAGLSAGAYGATNIGLRHPALFGTIEGWSGYYEPLHDGPFRHADAATLRANDPVELARAEAPALRRYGTRFFLSTGPSHSHWFRAAQTVAFARELRRLRISVVGRTYTSRKREWQQQLDAGLSWALAPPP
jgi:enterochelin esterase-like enzyme